MKRNDDVPGILCPSFLPVVISAVSSHVGSADGVMKKIGVGKTRIDN